MRPRSRAPLAPLAVLLALTACAPARHATPAPSAAPATAGVAAVAAAPDHAVPTPAAFTSAVAAGTRTEAGVPGDAYWQQRVSYEIQAELDPETALLRGSEHIVYHNRSPDVLPEIVLNLYQNVFSEGVQRNRHSAITGGVTLDRVVAQGATLEARNFAPGYSVNGTIGRVHLPTPLQPGDSLVLEIDWHFTVPPEGTYRTAWQDALGGRAFVVAQWYPQIATYDDLRGWDATPYLGDGEFYLEYGDFDVAITVPSGWLVGATGELQRPEDVLTADALARLRAAPDPGTITTVVGLDDIEAGSATRVPAGNSLIWRFRAENVRDFAFATSNRYVWDLAHASVPSADGGTRTVPIHALYRPGAPNWERAAEFGRHAISFLSDAITPYPYPQVTIAEGSVGGMEYPQVMFIGKPQQIEGLYGVIAHEAVHFWFPMVVGSDEARHAWMDEGMANFWEGYASGDFFDDPDPHTGDRRSYFAVAGTEAEVPLMRHTDLVTPYGARGVAAYTKPAVLFRSLRSIMGPDRFDRAVREYVRDWSHLHPSPWDFFNAMELAMGEDLDWFFEPWWFGTGTLDQAIESVERVDGGIRVTIADQGDITMPVLLVATMADGSEIRQTVARDRWRGMGSISVEMAAGGPVTRVAIDPEQLLPDVDREDNVWTGSR